MGLNIDEQKAVERFRRDVVEPSQSKLVVLDFWAEWCGPCKALAPVLEKVCGEYAERGVVLVKLNVDEEGFIASQFQVRSIPTVYAIFGGQPVADLTNARTESQLRQMLDQLLEKLPIEGGHNPADGGPTMAEIAQILEMAEEALANGDMQRAGGMFMQIAQIQPDNAHAQAGLIRALVASGHAVEARQVLESLPPEMFAEPALARARTALELAENAPDDSELAALRAAAQAAPQDMEAQLALANAAFAAGGRDEAADTLLAMIRTDATWNDGAARAKLLQIFEAVGLEEPWVAGVRRKLSLILFG